MFMFKGAAERRDTGDMANDISNPQYRPDKAANDEPPQASPKASTAGLTGRAVVFPPPRRPTQTARPYDAPRHLEEEWRQTSLKRGRSDFEDYGDQRGQSRAPRSPSYTRLGYCYSPPRERLPNSPSNTRYALVRERGDHWEPDSDVRNLPFARSPDFPDRRLDREGMSSRSCRWSSSRRSRSPSTSSPPRRTILSSPTSKRGPIDDSGLRFDVPEPIESAQLRHVSPGRMAPRRKSSDQPVANSVKTIEFKGLKDVPSGPRIQAPRLDQDDPIPHNVGSDIKGLPHIFISARNLQPNWVTVKHLRGFLMKYQHGISNIMLDRSGYYVLFDKSDQGRETLNRCYKQKNGEMLFSQYALEMTCHPHGQTHASNDAPVEVADHQEPVGLPVTNKRLQEALLEKRATVSERSANELNRNDTQATEQSSSDLHVRLTSPTLSSPILGSTRLLTTTIDIDTPRTCQDRDQTPSSISGATDFSTSKTSRCHICREPPVGESDVLIRCSTCPRKYHRRCHVNSPTPPTLVSGHSWQCGRCVKKQVHPCSRLSDTSPVSESATNALSVESSTHLATTSARVGLQDTMQPYAREASSQNDEINQQANDLVGRSFEGNSPAEPARAKPVMVRKKLSDSASVPLTVSHSSGSAPLPNVERSGDVITSQNVVSGVCLDSSAQRDQNLDRDLTTESKAHFHVREVLKAHDSPLAGAHEDAAHAPPTISGRDTIAAASEAPTIHGEGLSHERPVMKMKPSKALRRLKCVRCNRAIAYVPNGSARLCTYCKNSLSSSTEPLTSRNTTDSPLPKTAEIESSTTALKAAMEHESALSLTLATAPRDGLVTAAASTTPHFPAHTSVIGTSKPVKIRKLSVAQVRREDAGLHQELSSLQEGDESDIDFWKAPLEEQTVQAVAPQNKEQHVACPARQMAAHTPKSPGLRTDLPAAVLQSNDLGCETTLTAPSVRSIPPPTPATDVEMVDSPRSMSKSGKKRASYRVAPRTPHDLGNYQQRPKGTYEKLIGMALLANADRAMLTSEVCEWVANNIPGYQRDAVWMNGLKATISMHREGNSSNNVPRWKYLDTSQLPYMVKLMPGIENKLLHWDPVLKEPRSPGDIWYEPRQEMDDDKIASPIEKSTESHVANGHMDIDSPTQLDTHSKANTRIETQLPPPHQQDQIRLCEEAAESESESVLLVPAATTRAQSVEDHFSSDDEPIARKRRKMSQASSVIQHTPVHAAAEAQGREVDEQIIKESDKAPFIAQPRQEHTPQAPLRHLSPVNLRLSLAELIKQELESVDYSATSLFEEWPEYHPDNGFDHDVKIKEIEQRPNRKYRKKPSEDPWSNRKPNRIVKHQVPADTSTRTTRTRPVVKDHWMSFEDGQARQYESIEEMFGLPSHPVAFVSEGQIVFRDGTRNEDGSLPRAREVFKTGYGGVV